ncbi:MAG: aspartate carbamoyltransferase [candidate division NC10 bacterium]|nr:aspartate carbamoyltransferase [candidate division NC10 bacterium]
MAKRRVHLSFPGKIKDERLLWLMALSILAMLLTALPVLALEEASELRLDEVARRGAQVMPFSLEQTTHIFTKTEKGGLQQVIVKETSNTEQVKLIQAHLSKISREFAQGDFSDPAKIHGEGMPGLAELRKAKPGEIRVEYKELTNGAQIDYSTDDPALIEAVHQWFEVQLSDHARHAIPGDAKRPMHAR